MNLALQATLLQLLQLLLAFISAYAVHKVFGGTAFVQRQGIRLGGAAATFFLVFYMLNHYLPDVRTQMVMEAASAQPVAVSTQSGVSEIAPVSGMSRSLLNLRRE